MPYAATVYRVMTSDLVLIMLVLVVAGNLYLSVRALSHTRQLIAQVAVLTLRVTDMVDAVAELDTDLRAELTREP
jgi:hypothetical protein